MHCSGPRARSSHPAVPDQTPNQVHALSFHVFLVPALSSASSQLPAALVFPPGTAFQAFGVGLLNSRLSVLSSGLSTVPSKAQHPWLPALHPCWGCVSQPASSPAVVLCTQALGLLSGFGCAALPVQPQRLLFPHVHVTVFWEEDFQHFWKLCAALGGVLFFPESPNYHFHSDIIITASFHNALSPYPFYSSSQSIVFAVKTCLCLLFLFLQSCWLPPEPFRNLPLWFMMMCFHYSLPHHERSCRSRRNLSFSPSCCFRDFPPE